MAIFYNHIKGCGYGTTGGEDSTTDLWTWIKWASVADNKKLDVVQQTYLPEIWINIKNSFPTEEQKELLYAGKIITSNAQDQEMQQPFTFTEPIYCKTGLGVHNSEKILHLYWTDTSLCLNSQSKEGLEDLQYKAKSHIFDDGGVLIKKDLQVTENALLEANVQIKGGIYAGKEENYQQQPGVIKADSKCEALYFNATSDRRAKSNITPAEFSALNVVNKLPIYTFQYLNVEDPVIGLIAQEAAEHDLDGFNMVTNLEASGEFGDFMQMKESKLVYVLWKAVQELSAEVEELKAQITSLK